jgi:hypothetical protein
LKGPVRNPNAWETLAIRRLRLQHAAARLEQAQRFAVLLHVSRIARVRSLLNDDSDIVVEQDVELALIGAGEVGKRNANLNYAC